MTLVCKERTCIAVQMRMRSMDVVLSDAKDLLGAQVPPDRVPTGCCCVRQCSVPNPHTRSTA